MPKSIDVKLDLRDTADYRLVVPDRHVEVVAGTTAEYVVNIDRLGSYADDVILESSGTPSGSTPSFSDEEISVGESSVFSIGTTGVTPGTYSLSTINSYEAPAYGSDYDWLNVDNADRLIDWTYCGIPGGIPTRTTIYQTFSPGATTAQINTSIQNCPNGQVVKLNAGTYSLGSLTFGSKVGVTLRGAGAGVTIINSTATDCISTSDPGGYGTSYSISSGATKGSTSIVTSTTPSAVTVGGMVMIDLLDPPSLIYCADGPGRNISFMHRCTGKTGNTLTIEPPLAWDMTGRSPLVYATGTRASLCGVEDLTINSTGGVADHMIMWWYVDRCWLSGVELKNTGYFFVYMFAGLQCEIRRCYIHGAYGFPGQWDGDGIMMNYGTSWCRIEDNIGDRTNYLVLTQRSSANAIMYNHFWESGQFGADANMQHALSCNHLQHCVMNLWEGNVAEQITNDGYHGSTSHQAIFRNNFHGDHPSVTGMRKMVDLCRGSYYHSVIGNVLGSASWEPTFYSQTGEPGNDETATIYRLGYPNGGNNDLSGGPTWIGYPAVYPDTLVSSTLLRHGNHDYYNNAIVWDGGITSHDIPISLFYSSRPSWFGSEIWPPIGPDVSGLVTATPAKTRWDSYVAGGKTNVALLF